MRAIAIALAFAACTPTQRTTALALSSTTFIVADWYQTQGITAACQELNPIIGACGERVSVNTYFPVAIAAHLTVGLLLPAHWRDVWFGAVAGAQVSTVWSNWLQE